MANGFFLGGMAEGIESSNKQALAERTQAADVGLRTRGLDIQEQSLKRAEQQDYIKRGDELIANTMASVSETIKSAVTVGKDPAAVLKLVTPMVEDAKNLAARIGRDPRAIDAQVQALTLSPTGTETATAAGRAEGTKTAVSQQTAEGILNPGAGGDGGGFIIDPAKRGEAENKLRDFYTAQSKDFKTLRDFKDRVDVAGDTGAGDISLIFSFMKILDPSSTVREGEFATARNAAGVPSAITAVWNKIVGEGQISPTARKEFRAEVEKIYTKAASRQSDLTNKLSAIAKRQGLNPKNIIIDSDTAPAMQTTPGGTSFRVLP